MTTTKATAAQYLERIAEYEAEIAWLEQNEIEPYRANGIRALRSEIEALRRELARNAVEGA